MDEKVLSLLKYYILVRDNLVDEIINSTLLEPLDKLRIISQNDLLPYGDHYRDAPEYIIDWMEDTNLEINKKVDFFNYATKINNEETTKNILQFVDDFRIIGTHNSF